MFPRSGPNSRGDFAATLGFEFKNATQIDDMTPLERARYLVSETAFWQGWRNVGPPKDREARYRDAEARIGPLRQWLDQLGPELERDGHQLQLLSGPPKVYPPSSNGWQSSSALIAAGDKSYAHAVPSARRVSTERLPQSGVGVRHFNNRASIPDDDLTRSTPVPASSDDVTMQLETRVDADGAGAPRHSHTTPALPRASGPDNARRPSSDQHVSRPTRSTPDEISLELSSVPALAMPKAPRTSIADLNLAALGAACRQDLALLDLSLAAASSSSSASSASELQDGRKRKRSELNVAPTSTFLPPKHRGRPRKTAETAPLASATVTTVEQDVALVLSTLSNASVADLLERSVVGLDGSEVGEGALPELTGGEVTELHAFLDACLRVPPAKDKDAMDVDGRAPVLALPECLVGLADHSSVGVNEAFAAAVLRHRQRARLRVAVETWQELNGELITEAALGRIRTHLRIILGHAGPLAQDTTFGNTLENADGRLPDPPLARSHKPTATLPVLPKMQQHAKDQSTSTASGFPHANGVDGDETLVEVGSTRSISTETAGGTPEPADLDHGVSCEAQFDALAKTLNLEPPDPDSMPRTFGELGSMLDGMISQFQGLVDRMEIDMVPWARRPDGF